MVKKCPSCNLVLDESKFNWRIKNVRLASYCKECSRRYIRDHYQRNLKYYLNKAKKRNKEVKKQAFQYIGDFLRSHPCVDCGEKDIVVLEFDHKDRNDKSYDINRIIKTGLTFRKLKEEILKCEVRCANCHRRKTHRENNSWKIHYAPVA